MKAKYYHTGGDSFDYPQIKAFKPNEQPFEFGFGPFATFEEAKADFIDYFKVDIRNAKDALSNVQKLKLEPSTGSHKNGRKKRHVHE